MADKTVTSLFHSRDAAMAAVSRLEATGIARGQISIFDSADVATGPTTRDSAYTGTAATPYAGTADTATSDAAYSSRSLTDRLTDVGVDDADAHAYTEGVRRGDVLVVVACNADEVDRVVDQLDRDGIHDLDERRTAWRAEGWQDYQAPATSVPATGRVEPIGRVRVHGPVTRSSG